MARLNIQSVVMMEAPTVVVMSRYKLASNEIRKIPARLFPRHRKQIIITNEDNSNKMAVIQGSSEVSNNNELKGLTVFVNSSITIWTSDDIYIKATDGAITEVQVLEVVYA